MDSDPKPPPKTKRVKNMTAAELEYERAMNDLKFDPDPDPDTRPLPAINFDAPRIIPEDYPLKEELILDVINRLGLRDKTWSSLQARTLQSLGSVPWVNIGKRAIAMTLFQTLDQAKEVMDLVVSRMKGENNVRLTEENWNGSARSMAEIMKAMNSLTPKIVSCLETGMDAGAKEKEMETNRPKPKNRPPQFGVQVNVAPGANAQVGMIGNGGPKPPI